MTSNYFETESLACNNVQFSAVTMTHFSQEIFDYIQICVAFCSIADASGVVQRTDETLYKTEYK